MVTKGMRLVVLYDDNVEYVGSVEHTEPIMTDGGKAMKVTLNIVDDPHELFLPDGENDVRLLKKGECACRKCGAVKKGTNGSCPNPTCSTSRGRAPLQAQGQPRNLTATGMSISSLGGREGSAPAAEPAPAPAPAPARAPTRCPGCGKVDPKDCKCPA